MLNGVGGGTMVPVHDLSRSGGLNGVLLDDVPHTSLLVFVHVVAKRTMKLLVHGLQGRHPLFNLVGDEDRICLPLSHFSSLGMGTILDRFNCVQCG